MTSPALILGPADFLTFHLKVDEQNSKCTLSLSHPGGAGAAPIAFKVKTTQPRRYLVRPNQGVIPAGKNEQIQILLVDKDKETLIQSFQRLGQPGLDHSKDKFLVQSCFLSDDALADYEKNGYEALTSMWNSLPPDTQLASKKLPVKHHVVSTEATAAPVIAEIEKSKGAPVEKMSQEELVQEITNLRRKYDELVAFSVNLTAERDILNNTLEQTKRDLNQAQQQRKTSRGGDSAAAAPATSSSVVVLLVVAVVALILGARLQDAGIVEALPILGRFVGVAEEAVDAPANEL